jgi:predicted RNA-binding Zn ribbon-like protein
MSLAHLPRLGGALCLDFVNTVDPRYGDERVEYLGDYGALVEWAVWAGAVAPGRREALLAAAGGDAVHERALALREHLFGVLGPRRDAASLAGLNRELRRLAGRAELRPAGGGYAVEWTAAGDPEEVLWPVAASAAALALSPALERVRECAGDRCGWLFLDTSKAGRRRWCRMEICGNRAKARRRRARDAQSSAG